MPKINTKVNSTNQQQRIRRMKQREADFATKFIDNNINCVSLDSLYRASEAEITALIPIMKKIIQHNSKTAELINERCYKPDEISNDQYNIALFEHLNDTYKGHKGKTLKYKYDHRKDKFRQIIIEENQLQFNNCLSEDAENSIKKLFNDIDISNYTITDTFLKNEKKEQDSKRPMIILEPEPEITIPKPKLKPKPEIPIPKPKPKPKQSKKPDSDSDSDSDSDIEADLKRLEARENTDQDKNTTEDIKNWRNKIYKLWKADIEDILNSPNDYDNDDEEAGINDIIDMYVSRTKRQTRGIKADVGQWATRNTQSTKKIITSIIRKIQKQLV